MPHLLNTLALETQLMNLITDENVKIFVFCMWQAREQIFIIKININKQYFFNNSSSK